LETFAAQTSRRAQCFSQFCARYMLPGVTVLVDPNKHVMDFISENIRP